MYWLTAFGTQDLPQHDVSFNAGTAPAQMATVETLNAGMYDTYGRGRSPQRFPLTLTYTCVVAGSSTTTAAATIAGLKGQIGQRNKLVRQMLSDSSYQWCWARLVDVDDAMSARMTRWRVPVTLTFALLGKWNGVQHWGTQLFDQGELYWDDGLYFDGEDVYTMDQADEADQTIVVNNGGNIPVANAVITVTAVGTPITLLKIMIAGASEIQFSGSLAVGKQLIIDCKKKQITNDGANAYSSFSLTANHVIAEWLVLEPGDNSVVVNRTGGANSTIEFAFYDGWA